jgi:hypothetical protein
VARPVYSSRFFAVNGFTGGPTVVYTAPAGATSVLRCISIVTPASGVAGGTFLRHVGTGAVMLGVYFPTGTILSFDILEGRWVIEPYDTLELQTFGGYSADVYASGYLLTLP